MHKKIKILYILDHYHTFSGGTERQIYDLVKGLNKNLFEIEACIFRHATDYFEKGDFPCPVVCFNIGSFFSPTTYYKLYNLRKYMRQKNYDIVQTIFNDSAISIPFITFGLDVRLVSTRRDMGFWYTPMKLLILKMNSILINKFLVNSIAVRDNVHEMEGVALEKITVIYNGHDFSRFELPKQADLMKNLSIPMDSPIIGIVANMRPVKRVKDLISAFKSVLNIVPESYLIIVGHIDPSCEDYKHLVRTYGIEDRVRFLGMIDEPVPIIKNFSVGINCSETEGLSNSIIEYMACGIPVIATDTSGNRELIKNGETGILVPVGDTEQLSRAIVQILQDEKYGKELASKSIKCVAERFNLDKVINQYTDFYMGLVEDEELKKNLTLVQNSMLEK